MQQRHLGKTLQVSAVGFGCMGLTGVYGDQEAEASIATLQRAVEVGVTLFDTAEVYGPYKNEELVGRALKPVRDKILIATKFGFDIGEPDAHGLPVRGLNSRPENVKAVADASLKRLGIDYIDLFYQHRVDKAVPIEETVGAMAELVQAGKVRALGLSEPNATTLRRAQAVHPISAVQSEYSLWTRDPETGVLPVCRELGIGFVPYSPLGRGFLTGTITDKAAFGDKDYRRSSPRFQDEAFDANLALVEALKRIAAAKSATAAQLALAWVLHQGDFIVPIPGTRKIHRLEENVAAADIVLSKEELAEIEAAFPHEAVVGGRYNEAGLAMLDRV